MASGSESLWLGEGRVRVGVDPSTSSGQACGEPVEPSPLPFIPSHRREGRFLEDVSEKVRIWVFLTVLQRFP